MSHKKVSWMGDVRTAALLNERGSVRESVCVVTMELVVLEVLWLAIYYMYLAYSSHYLCGWLIRCSKSNSHFTALWVRLSFHSFYSRTSSWVREKIAI